MVAAPQLRWRQQAVPLPRVRRTRQQPHKRHQLADRAPHRRPTGRHHLLWRPTHREPRTSRPLPSRPLRHTRIAASATDGATKSRTPTKCSRTKAASHPDRAELSAPTRTRSPSRCWPWSTTSPKPPAHRPNRDRPQPAPPSSAHTRTSHRHTRRPSEPRAPLTGHHIPRQKPTCSDSEIVSAFGWSLITQHRGGSMAL